MIELKNISVSYKDEDKKVLNNLSLSIRQNDFCIIMGANGCGKSTLFKVISEEIKPSVGTICINGGVAKVVQDISVGVVKNLNVLENLALSEMKKPSFKSYNLYQDKAKALLKTLKCNLEDKLYQPVASLSGGQQQMLATLMVLNQKKPILLLDEHTSALDINRQKTLMNYSANEIKKRGLTTLMITHKFDEALSFGNRLIIMSHGKIIKDLSGPEKKAMTYRDLIDLFYQTENKDECYAV